MFLKIGVITSIILSLALLIAVPVSSYARNDAIQRGLCSGVNLVIGGPCVKANVSDAEARVNKMIRSIINILSSVVGIVAVMMVVYGGLKYITSGGNDSKVSAAKNTLIYAIVGLIIVAFAQVIVKFVLSNVITR